MKDSLKQNKKHKKKENKKNVEKHAGAQDSSQQSTASASRSNISSILDFGKRYFFWIIAIITIVNLLLGITIIYIIGEIEKSIIGAKYSSISIPEVPVAPNNPNLQLSAESVMVYEPESRSVVFQKQGNLRFAPASTTKIVTALVSLEQYSLNEYLTAFGVSEVEGSNMGLVEGEVISVQSLLYGLMLPSGNDAAHVLASNYPGGKEAFIARMNAKAQELRLYNTSFVDPAGLDDGNYTTAFDLARLAVFALQNEDFRKIVETKYVVVYDRTFSHVHELENLNKLLYKDGVFGVKTGYTEEAGQVLVTSLHHEDKTYIIVVLKSIDRFYDTDQIMNEIVNKITLEKIE